MKPFLGCFLTKRLSCGAFLCQIDRTLLRYLFSDSLHRLYCSHVDGHGCTVDSMHVLTRSGRFGREIVSVKTYAHQTQQDPQFLMARGQAFSHQVQSVSVSKYFSVIWPISALKKDSSDRFLIPEKTFGVMKIIYVRHRSQKTNRPCHDKFGTFKRGDAEYYILKMAYLVMLELLVKRGTLT